MMVKTAPCRLLQSSWRYGFGEELKMEFKEDPAGGPPKCDGQRRRRLPSVVGFLYKSGKLQFGLQLYVIISINPNLAPAWAHFYAPAVSEFFTTQLLNLQQSYFNKDFICSGGCAIVAACSISPCHERGSKCIPGLLHRCEPGLFQICCGPLWI